LKQKKEKKVYEQVHNHQQYYKRFRRYHSFVEGGNEGPCEGTK
jgi:hypothetical protein